MAEIVPIKKSTTPILDRVGELEKRIVMLERVCANLIKAIEEGELPARKSGLIVPNG